VPAGAGAAGLLVESVLFNFEAQPVIRTVDGRTHRAPEWRELGVKGVEGSWITTPQRRLHLPVRILEEGHPSPLDDNLEPTPVPVDKHSQGSREAPVEHAMKHNRHVRPPEVEITRHTHTLPPIEHPPRLVPDE